MASVLGKDGKLYRNTGTYAVPVWNEIDCVRDLTLTLDKALTDASKRGNNGFRAQRGTLKEATVEIGLIYDTASDDFTAFQQGYFDDTDIEIAAMDGDITVSGTQGLRGTMSVNSFTRNEPLEEVMTLDISLTPSIAANPPEWFMIP